MTVKSENRLGFAVSVDGEIAREKSNSQKA